MARRKRAKTRTRTVYKKAARRRKSSGSAKVAPIQLPSMLYGAARGYLSNLIAPVTSKIPLGGVADEAGMIFANYMLAKNVKNKTLKQAAISGLIIENARLGEAVIDGSLLGGLGLNKASAGGDGYFYG